MSPIRKNHYPPILKSTLKITGDFRLTREALRFIMGLGVRMDQRRPSRILVAVPHLWLMDSLAQLLRRGPVEILPAPDRDALLAQASAGPDLLVIDPFAFGEPGLELLKRVRQAAPAAPIVVIIPIETNDYRDAALRLGANWVLTAEQTTTDLLSTVERLLARTALADGVAGRINTAARQSAPMGESAFSADGVPSDRHVLRNRAVERLASPLTPIPAADLSVSTDDRPPLRGLSLSAGFPSGRASERVVRTACNLNCGYHFCGLDVTVRDGHIVKIEPADFPDDRYRRICLKGISHVQMEAHSDRLLYPLKRRGPRGAGEWERLSWDQALDEIAARMKELAEQHGPESLMFFPYSGQLSALNGMSGVYQRLAALLGASATDVYHFGIDSAVPGGVEDTLGAGAGYLANDYADLPNSRLVLIWGGDPANSRMNWWPFFLEAQRGGTHLVAIDPRLSVTAAKCNEWLPIRPGSDLYLALAMLRLIVERNWLDRDFVLRHTVAPLLVREDDGRFVRRPDPLVWDQAARRAVPAGEVTAPALEGRYVVDRVNCRPAFDLLREMLAPYTPEVAAARTGLAAERIVALTERYALTKPARIFTLYGVDRWHHGATFGRLIATLAAYTGNLGIPGGGAGVDGICEGLLITSDFSVPDGRCHRPVNPATLPDHILRGQPYPIKAVWAAFNNWLNQWPDQRLLREEILPRLDLLVVADHFLTETARWADYVLPAATFFEREDMVKGPVPYIQHQPAILPPPGECRSDLEMMAGLAERVGLAGYFNRPAAVYLQEVLNTGGDGMAGLTVEGLRAAGVLRRDVPTKPPVAHRDRKFRTPTGRVEFYVERLVSLGRALPDYEPPVEANPDGELIRRFPLVCITEHSRYRVHSTFGNAPWLREIDPEPRAVLHPDTAQPRRITEGDLVRVFNARGYVVLRARLSQAVPPGTVYLSQGWQSPDFYAGHAQSLTHTASNPANPFGPNSSFSDVLVEVAPEGPEGG